MGTNLGLPAQMGKDIYFFISLHQGSQFARQAEIPSWSLVELSSLFFRDVPESGRLCDAKRMGKRPLISGLTYSHGEPSDQATESLVSGCSLSSCCVWGTGISAEPGVLRASPPEGTPP